MFSEGGKGDGDSKWGSPVEQAQAAVEGFTVFAG
jgi:hypothetical protein